jgi:hypothetical protein
VTTRTLAVQTLVVLEVTDCAPSLFVGLKTAVNPPPEVQIGFEGMLVIFGNVAVAGPIVKGCGPPEEAA